MEERSGRGFGQSVPTAGELSTVKCGSGSCEAEGLVGVAFDRNSFPLSLAQRNLWYLHQSDRASESVYCRSVSLFLVGELDKPALREALDRVVARHEIL